MAWSFPVAEYGEKDGSRFCERVDHPKDAQFWSVYGHLPEGGVECFEDFKTEQEANAFAEKLLSMFPNLRKYGLIDVNRLSCRSVRLYALASFFGSPFPQIPTFLL